MAFDNSTRRYNITAGLGSSKFDSILRSPEADIPSLKESNSILRNRFTDNLTASARARSSRGQTSVTKKVSYADFASPKLDSGRTDLDQLERQERATTPKKYYFFSEYLKDFNPASGDAKTAAESGGFESSGYSKNQGARKEYLLNIDTREPAPRPSEVGSGGEYSSRKWKGNYTATNHDNFAKKQEIKQRLSQLSEKLYSPLKSNLRTDRRGSEANENIGDRSYGREGMSGRDYSHYETVGERGDDDLKVSARLDNQNLDVKYRIMVQEYENSIRNLKAHLEKVEKSNADIVRSLREELRVSREDLLREKTESAIKASEDTKALAERVRELEEHLKEQREKNKQQEDLLEENKAFQDKKITEMTKEIEKIKTERERKVEELNNLLKSQNQSQRDIIAKIRTENESIVKKVRDEQNYSVRDLNSQLEKKNAELERIQKERADALTSLNDKVSSLQEITKNNQETYSRLNRTIELKDDEIEKLTRRLNETKKECSIFQNELDGLDYDKGKLEQENERLQTKINRLEKMLYGERKPKTSPHKGKF